MKTFSFVSLSLIVVSLVTGAGCAAELPSDPAAETSSEMSVGQGSCSKPLAQAVRDEVDEGGFHLVLVQPSDLPAAAKAKLKSLSAEIKKEELGFTVDPYKFETSAGTAFVLFYAGSDDDGAIVEVYSTSGKRLLSGSSPCGCEPIDWTDFCAHH